MILVMVVLLVSYEIIRHLTIHDQLSSGFIVQLAVGPMALLSLIRVQVRSLSIGKINGLMGVDLLAYSVDLAG